MTRLSTRIIIGCVLVLSAADVAAAQTMTANGTTGALSINRGDTVTITTSGSATNWVGLFPAGAGNSNFLQYVYLNGAVLITFQTGSLLPGAYEFRELTNPQPRTVVATSGVVTVRPPLLTVNGVAAPQSIAADPRASIQVDISSTQVNSYGNHWIGLYRIGAANTAWLDWAYLNGLRTLWSGSNPHAASFSMTLPNERGPYELRLFYVNESDVKATGPTIHSEVRTRAAGGDAHTLVVRPDGSVWVSGRNASGELGDDTTIDQPTPIQVPGLSDVVAVAAGASHSMALTATGSVYVWGANDAGQVGDGTNTPRLTPTLLSLTDVVAIAAGDQHSVALTSSGSLYTWGLNSSGALGNGTTTDSNVPIQVATGALAIGAGDHFTLFVALDRTVWGMGKNQDGTLGDGSYTNRTSPVQMIGASAAVAVSGGRNHALVLRSDGAVIATGRNALGQLGTGFVNDRSTPGGVSTLTNIVGIAAGDEFSVAIDKDGVAWGWGNNAAGQLGAATPSSRTTPAAIAGLSGTRFIAAGKSHVIALDANHAVMTFGENTAGALGDGTTTNRATPETNYGFSGRVAMPTFSVTSGTYGSDFNVVVSNATDGSTMRYTQNGSEPTASDSTVASGSSIAIANSQTLKVKAWKTGTPPSDVGSVAYEMKVATPSLSPGAGTFASPTSVTLSTGTSGAVVRYTLDGSNPTSSSAQYTSPVLVDHTSTLKATGFKSNWSDSNVNTGTYTMNFGTLAAPTVEPAAGTYTSAGTVTMSSMQEGAIIRFTTNGETPTASSAAYSSPLSLDGSMTVKAKAFHPDYTSSTETSRAYTLAAAPPTISPSTGVYTSAQDVTITAASGPSVTVRYTLEGSEPTEASTPYIATFSVETGTTVKARSFPSNGWAASTATSAALSFNYGTLAAPTASPDGGVFANAPNVTLSGPPGATIRYTIDGSEPSLSSSQYSSPIQLAAGTVTVKARAFQLDWTQSSIASATFTIDTTPPTISATLSPSANAAGWNNSAVTVQFTCSDNVSGVQCPSPVLLNDDGTGLLVTRVATDAAGNTESTSVTVNIDTVAPTIEINSTVPADTTNANLTVTAAVSDALSGIASGTCSGTGASISGGTMECTLPLTLGRNVILATAVDAAGNASSIGELTVRTTIDPIELTVAPATAAILVAEQRTLSAADQFGRVPANVTWSSGDELVATVETDEDGGVFAVGVGAGIATITADLDGETATMTLTVYAGTSLPVGVARWAAPSRGGIAASDTIILSAFGAEDAIYSVEYATTGATGNKNATVRGLGVDGTENWFGALPVGNNETIMKAMPHPTGGMIAVLHTYSYPPVPAAVIRYTGDGENSWRYQSGAWRMNAVTGGTGAVFVIEEGYFADGVPQLVILNGSTGAVLAKHVLPRLKFSDEYFPNGDSYEFHPAGLVVDARGHARFMVRHGHKHFAVDSGSFVTNILDLYDVAPDGTVAITQLDSLTQNPLIWNSAYLWGQSITPDGDGILAVFVRLDNAQDEQWKGKYLGTTNHSFSLPGPWHPTVSSIDGYGIGRGTEPTDPLTARNIRTGVMAWQNAIPGDAIISSESAAATVQESNGTIRYVDSDGVTQTTDGLPGAGQYAFGRFHVRGNGNTLQTFTWRPVDDFTSYVMDPSGDGLVQTPSPFGIFVKSHVVFEAVSDDRHTALWLMPRRQDEWQKAGHPYAPHFRKAPAHGDLHYATIGAGSDAFFPNCQNGDLAAAINRDRDFNEKPVDYKPLAVAPSNEDPTILTLLDTTSAFQNGVLEYDCWPGENDEKYNSNSFLHGLLIKVGLPAPTSIDFTPTLFPGWSKPVPTSYYSPPQ